MKIDFHEERLLSMGRMRDSQAEEQHTELDKDKVREVSQPLLESRT